jgi:hypothetical protein
MFSRPVGIVAAAFLAVAPLRAKHAHLGLEVSVRERPTP